MKIRTGKKRFPVENEFDEVLGYISFNPADPEILSRLYSLTDELEKLAKEYKTAENHTDPLKTAEAFIAISDKMRNRFDEAFQQPVSKLLFNDVSPLCALEDGSLVAESVLKEITDVMKPEIEKVRQATDARIKQYTEKYEKK